MLWLLNYVDLYVPKEEGTKWSYFGLYYYALKHVLLLYYLSYAAVKKHNILV